MRYTIIRGDLVELRSSLDTRYRSPLEDVRSIDRRGKVGKSVRLCAKRTHHWNRLEEL
jgi:hypothetical protein